MSHISLRSNQSVYNYDLARQQYKYCAQVLSSNKKSKRKSTVKVRKIFIKALRLMYLLQVNYYNCYIIIIINNRLIKINRYLCQTVTRLPGRPPKNGW